MIKQDMLWQQVAAFRFDDSRSALTFSQRLARENGWSLPYARRVVEEYRRFLYLAMRAGHPVTPSDEVDQAWHLHLVYTRSYWEDLCRDVLGKPLHHGPTRGGEAEAHKFCDWYGATLASYRRLFEMEPPQDIWPPPGVRFSDEDEFLRINVSKVWLVPRAGVRRASLLAACATGLGLVLAACGKTGSGETNPFLVLVLLMIAVGVIAAFNKNNRNGPRGKGRRSGGGCSSFFGTGGCSSSDRSYGSGHSRGSSHGGHGSGHSGCSSHGGHGSGHSGCGSDGGGGHGCGSSGCGGGGCGGGGD